jgi:hypothetical protein
VSWGPKLRARSKEAGSDMGEREKNAWFLGIAQDGDRE